MGSSNKDPKKLEFKEEQMIQHLLSQLDDKREDFGIFAIRELKHFHSAKIVEALSSVVKNDSKNSKKIAAIRSLKARKPNPYIKDIIMGQLISSSEDVRSEAAAFLMEYGSLIEKDLRMFLEKDLPDYSKEKVIWLLGQVGNKDAVSFLEKQKQSINQEMNDLINDSIKSIKGRNIRLLLDDLKKNEE
ncbi:MAG: HEAT repeat domain-containing protein [Candidatus Heimdallarchaeota archaeon]